MEERLDRAGSVLEVVAVVRRVHRNVIGVDGVITDRIAAVEM